MRYLAILTSLVVIACSSAGQVDESSSGAGGTHGVGGAGGTSPDAGEDGHQGLIDAQETAEAGWIE